MNKFFTDLFSSFFIDLKNRKWVYVCAICTIVIGIIIGIILCFTVDDLNVMLSLSEKNFVSYMKGEAELGTIFLEKFRWIIVAYLFIIVFSFTSVTFILGLMYICYQSAIIILTMAALISSFGFTGFLNALLIVLPFNLILVIIISLLLVNLYIFFYNNKKSGEKMLRSLYR